MPDDRRRDDARPPWRIPPAWATPGRLTCVMIGLGLLWRATRYAVAFPLWGDEAFLAVSLLTRDLAGLVRPLEFRQVAPPGFLWAERGVVWWLGGSERALRLLPFLAGLASLWLFWEFCRRAATRRVALVAVALLAASFYPVRHAAEVKPYAIDLLVALVVTSLGWRIWRDPKPRGPWLALGTAAALGVWWSYPAVFPIAAVGLTLLARGWAGRPGPTLARASLLALASAASWAVMFLVFARAQQGETAWLSDYWGHAFPPLATPWRLPGWLLAVHTGSLVAYPLGGDEWISLPTTLLVVLGVQAVARRPARRPLLAMLLGPLPVALVAASLGRYPYGGSTRLVLYMAPAVCLLAAEGIVAALKWQRQLSLQSGVVAVVAALGLIPIVGAACDVAMPYRRSADLQYRQFVRDLARRTRPGDSWVIYDGGPNLPRGGWVMSSMWVQRVARLRYYALSLAPVPVRWAHEPGEPAPSPSGRTWLIVHDHGAQGVFSHVERLRHETLMTARLGPPRSSRHALPVGSTVHVHTFDPPAAATAQAPTHSGLIR